MKPANIFSYSRFLLAAAVLLLAWMAWRQSFAWVLVLGFATDMLDGFLARRNNNESNKGAKLDSAADATFFLCSAVGIIIFEYAYFRERLWWIIIAFTLYFLQLGLAYWRYGQSSNFHTYAAKTAALVQGIFIIATAFFGPWDWLFYLTVGISILETLEEIGLIFIFSEPKSDVKGLWWVNRKKWV